MTEPFDDVHLHSIDDNLMAMADHYRGLLQSTSSLRRRVEENTLLLRRILNLLPPLPTDEQPSEQPAGLLVSTEIDMIELIVDADVAHLPQQPDSTADEALAGDFGLVQGEPFDFLSEQPTAMRSCTFSASVTVSIALVVQPEARYIDDIASQGHGFDPGGKQSGHLAAAQVFAKMPKRIDFVPLAISTLMAAEPVRAHHDLIPKSNQSSVFRWYEASSICSFATFEFTSSYTLSLPFYNFTVVDTSLRSPYLPHASEFLGISKELQSFLMSSNLNHVSPVVFLYLLNECYTHGRLTATNTFRSLPNQVHQALCNSPQPGPATFVLWCLCILPMFGIYSEGLSHLVISALSRLFKRETITEDTLRAKVPAAHLFINMVGGIVNLDEKIILKVTEVFDIQLVDIMEALCQLTAANAYGIDVAKTFVAQYIFRLLENRSFMAPVTLLEHFSIRQSGQSFLVMMMDNKQFPAAETWATFLGTSMLCILVQEYVDRNMVQQAYDIIKKNNLRQEFPHIFQQCTERLLKQLAEQALWDLAEAKPHGNKQLIPYLIYLAMEAGYSEKVDELCDRYSLEGFPIPKGPEACLLHDRYLDLNAFNVEDVIWVDEVDALRDAPWHIENCKVVGVDCEWNPPYVQGRKPHKVSIMQIASTKLVSQHATFVITKWLIPWDCCYSLAFNLEDKVVLKGGGML